MIRKPGEFEDNTPLFRRGVPPGPEPFLTRANEVEMKGQVTFYIAFKQPIEVYSLKVEETLDTIGGSVFTVCKRINEEIFFPRNP